MVLSLVMSKADGADGPKEARITSNSGIDDLLLFLNLLGVEDWELQDKGSAARLESNGSELYVAIGPCHPRDRNKFLEQARLYVER